MANEGLGASWEKGGYPAYMGQYVLLRSLARGGMGEVHLAKHGGLAGIQKYCVVKTLKRFATSDEEYVRRFVDEARVVVSLQHKNICPVFDVGRVEGRYYLAMEFIAGRDLRALVREAEEQGVEISPAMALFIAGEVLEALDYAHRARDPNTGEPLRLVHRDISPQNVMLSFEGEVKLIDFGLAASSLKKERTNPNVVMGKLAYMPPEQLDGKDVDGRSDLFAAAVVLYELLAKERFYAGMTDGEILMAASSRTFEPRKLGEFDDDLQRLLRDAINPDRSQRLPDCGELKDRIVRYQMAKGLVATSRDLRRFLERLFPDDPQRLRGMLAQHAGQRAPSVEQGERSQRIAVAPSAEPPDPPALKGIQELEGMSDSMLRAAAQEDVEIDLDLDVDLDLNSGAPGSQPLDPASMAASAPGSQPLNPASLAGDGSGSQPVVPPPAANRDGSEPTEPTREVHKQQLQSPAHAPAVAMATPPSSDPFATAPRTDSGANPNAEATVVISRASRTGDTPVVTDKKESKLPLLLAGAITLALVGGGALFLSQRAPTDDAAKPPASAVAQQEPAPPPVEEPPAAVPEEEDPGDAEAADATDEADDVDAVDETAEAAGAAAPEEDGEDEAPTDDTAGDEPADDEPLEAAAAEEVAAEEDAKDPALSAAERRARAEKRRAARKKAAARRAARRKAAAAKKTGVSWQKTERSTTVVPKGPPPKLRAGAKPEAKIHYLEMYCRRNAKCAGKLVNDFRAMRVSNAKKFWSKVDACVMICSPGSLQ